VRVDAQAPHAYGSRVTYDLPLHQSATPKLAVA